MLPSFTTVGRSISMSPFEPGDMAVKVLAGFSKVLRSSTSSRRVQRLCGAIVRWAPLYRVGCGEIGGKEGGQRGCLGYRSGLPSLQQTPPGSFFPSCAAEVICLSVCSSAQWMSRREVNN